MVQEYRVDGIREDKKKTRPIFLSFKIVPM